MIKLLIGGSPCTYWSVAQKKNREVEAKGLGWELFKNYLIAKEKFKPDFFLYENNKSAAQAIKDQISRELGVELMYINSALVSAQNRQRFYAFNWTIEQPEDRGIYLQDILESGFPFGDADGKTYCLTANYSKGSTPHQTLGHKKRTLAAEPIAINKRADGKARTIDAHMAKLENNLIPRINNPNPAKQQHDCICEIVEGASESKRAYEVKDGQIEVRGIKYPIKLPDGRYITRKLTPTECERLQTLPDGYTAAVCTTQRYRGLGNGWTAEVIIHILNGALKDVPRDEKIVVLSMYDGIGTGRYCLEKMGFTNVTYYAYEIDESAMKVALSNYPDIIQMGDAFALRDDNWELGKRIQPEQSAEAATKTESGEPADEATDLSDAPEEIKWEITENAEKLEARETQKQTEPKEATEKVRPTTRIDATAQLKKLAEERRALASIHPDTDRFTNDILAIEYAVSILEAMAI